MYRFVGLWVMVCGVLLISCSTDKTNPAGNPLLDRDPGQVVTLPAIDLVSGASFQELVLPIVLGQREELLIGQMNGFRFQSLLRFRVPVDSLAQAAGGTAGDFSAQTIQLNLNFRGHRLVDQTQVSVLSPDEPWQEIDTFVDSLTLSERNFSASVIADASSQVVGDSTLVVNLPVAYLESSRANNASIPEVEVYVVPEGIDDFLLDIVAREGQTIAALGRQPKLVMSYQVGSVVDTFQVISSADTYWGTRTDGGPRTDQILVSKGTFYSSILNFEMPTTVPAGSTINSAELELDLDLDRSYFDAFPFELYHVEFQPTINDTLYTLYNTENEINPETTVKFIFNQSLIQAWITGAQVNQGVAIRAVGTPIDFTWVRILDARLNLIYSTPPEL